MFGVNKYIFEQINYELYHSNDDHHDLGRSEVDDDIYMRSATNSGSPFELIIRLARLPLAAKSLLNLRAMPPKGVLL